MKVNCKTKQKFLHLVNHTNLSHTTNQSEFKAGHTPGAKRGKTRVSQVIYNLFNKEISKRTQTHSFFR